MAERAHPDDPGFQNRWVWRKWGGVLPVPRLVRSPYGTELRWRYTWASRHCRGKRVLDVPCGMGWGSSLIEGAALVVGMDLDPAAVKEASIRYPRVGKFVCADMTRLPFASGTFDVVTCLEGIEHIPESAARPFVAEAARVLLQDGLLLLSSPHKTAGGHSGNPYHLREYTPDELRDLLTPGFNVGEIVRREVQSVTVSYVSAAPRSVSGADIETRTPPSPF
jgi:2-polyprenyl-3-methyl-5-hydroxy-6-metoxy-1,4-benzoquinol methylase